MSSHKVCTEIAHKCLGISRSLSLSAKSSYNEIVYGTLTPTRSGTNKYTFQNNGNENGIPAEKKTFLYRFPEQSVNISNREERDQELNVPTPSYTYISMENAGVNQQLKNAVNLMNRSSTHKVYEKIPFPLTNSFVDSKTSYEQINDNDRSQSSISLIPQKKSVRETESTIDINNAKEKKMLQNEMNQYVNVRDFSTVPKQQHKMEKTPTKSKQPVTVSLFPSSTKTSRRLYGTNSVLKMNLKKATLRPNKTTSKINIRENHDDDKKLELPNWVNEFFKALMPATDVNVSEEKNISFSETTTKPMEEVVTTDQTVTSFDYINSTAEFDDEIANIDHIIKDVIAQGKKSLAVVLIKFDNDQNVPKQEIENIIKTTLETELDRILRPISEKDKIPAADTDKIPILENTLTNRQKFEKLYNVELHEGENTRKPDNVVEDKENPLNVHKNFMNAKVLSQGEYYVHNFEERIKKSNSNF